MTDREIVELSKIVVEALSNLKAEDIKPWLAGFVVTHPKELVQAVNLMVKDDERYKDATDRMQSWVACDAGALISWSHVTLETETSLRMAASWASSPLASRRQHEAHSLESAAWTAHKTRIGLPEQTTRAREASGLWRNRAFLNRNGVALSAWTGTEPWTDEVANLVAAVKCPRDKWVVLCLDGKVIEGLQTWPRA